MKKLRAGTRTSKRRKQRKAKLADADRLFSQYIRDRDGNACRACGSTYVVQCAHIISRRYRATRWSPDNAIALCRAHHMKWTCNPLAWEAWIEERFPGRLAELKARALRGVSQVDYAEVCEQIKAFRL